MQLGELAVQTWKKGLQVFPSNTHLANNIAFHYLKQPKWNDAATYLVHTDDKTSVNAAGLAALQGSQPSRVLAKQASLAVHINYLATWLRTQMAAQLPLDTMAYTHPHGLAYLHNYALTVLRNMPAQLLSDTLQHQLDRHKNNPALTHDILRLQAFAAQSVRNTDMSLRLLAQLIGLSDHDGGYYSYLAGLWAYAEGGYSRAAADFLKSYQRGYTPSLEIGLQVLALLPESLHKKTQKASWRKLQADNTRAWNTYMEQDPFFLFKKKGSTAPPSDTKGYNRLQLDFVQHLLDEERVDEAVLHMQTLPLPLERSQHFYWKLVQAESHFATHTDLLTLKRVVKSLPEQLPHKHYLIEVKDAASAQQLCDKVKEHPFQQWLILRTATKLQAKGYPLHAYELLLAAIETNPYAPLLQKAYALQALRLGQVNYAKAALVDLQVLLSKNAYATFLRTYLALQKVTNATDNW